MNLYTRNAGPNTRTVERVHNKPITSIGYCNYGIKALQFTVVGTNGMIYRLELDTADLAALNNARFVTYAKHFDAGSDT